MTWGRLSDDLDDDPRWWALPLAAHGVWQACLPRCLRHHDRVVTAAHLSQVFRVAADGEDGLADQLVEHGLWEVVEGGWAYVAEDWERMAYSEDKREVKRQAGRLGGQRSAAVREQRYGTAQPCPLPEADASKQPKHPPKQVPEALEAVPVPVPVVTIPATNVAGPARAQARTRGQPRDGEAESVTQASGAIRPRGSAGANLTQSGQGVGLAGTVPQGCGAGTARAGEPGAPELVVLPGVGAGGRDSPGGEDAGAVGAAAAPFRPASEVVGDGPAELPGVRASPSGAGAVVAAYVAACQECGSSATARARGRVGADARRLLADGKPEGVLVEAAREAARRNRVDLLEHLVGDLERAAAGVSTAPVRSPPRNPIDRAIDAIDFGRIARLAAQGRLV